jgi:hypothetical protein
LFAGLAHIEKESNFDDQCKTTAGNRQTAIQTANRLTKGEGSAGFPIVFG